MHVGCMRYQMQNTCKRVACGTWEAGCSSRGRQSGVWSEGLSLGRLEQLSAIWLPVLVMGTLYLHVWICAGLWDPRNSESRGSENM